MTTEMTICPTCFGVGSYHIDWDKPNDYDPVECYKCKGTGEVEYKPVECCGSGCHCDTTKEVAA